MRAENGVYRRAVGGTGAGGGWGWRYGGRGRVLQEVPEVVACGGDGGDAGWGFYDLAVRSCGGGRGSGIRVAGVAGVRSDLRFL